MFIEGEWRSAIAPWGVIRAVVTWSGFVLVLDDLNGDYNEIELAIYRTDTWDRIAQADDAGLPLAVSDGGGDSGGSGSLGEDGYTYVWSFGRESPGTIVDITVGVETHVVTADDDGWWLFVLRTEDDDMPVVRSQRRQTP